MAVSSEASRCAGGFTLVWQKTIIVDGRFVELQEQQLSRQLTTEGARVNVDTFQFAHSEKEEEKEEAGARVAQYTFLQN